MEKHLERELTDLLASLGVVLETPEAPRDVRGEPAQRPTSGLAASSDSEATWPGDTEGYVGVDEDALGAAEISLFQTSREHYGVFYRLDLVAASPQLRIFTPEDGGAVKMGCYLVRPALGTPVRDWFLVSRAHEGSAAYDEARETTENHLLFAAGEALKRLFWAGDVAEMDFPDEIEVLRLM